MKNFLEILRERERIHAAYIRVFESPDGQVVLAHLMKQAHVFKTTFVANDPNQTAMNEGMRRLVLSIIAYLAKDSTWFTEQARKQQEE